MHSPDTPPLPDPSLADLHAPAGLAPSADGPEAGERQAILLVGGAEVGGDALHGQLSARDHRVLRADSGRDALDQARLHAPDLVLLGLLLPDMTGFELLRRLKADPQLAHIAALFIAGPGHTQDGLRSLELGAADYLHAPVDSRVLAARVSPHLRLAAYRRQLDALTRQDGLTGVANRRHFDQTLALECRRAQRAQTRISVVLVNVDAFGAYNARHGHAAGDAALRQVAHTLRTGIRRPADLAARYDGATFVLVMPDTGPAQALRLAQTLCEAVAALQIPHGASKTGPGLTVSMGLATTEVGEDGLGEAVLQRALGELRAAQASGGNRVVTSVG